jgi:energy-coupling factor transport system ATP-binding protein
MKEDAFIRVEGVRYAYDDTRPPALDDLDLSVDSGEYVALMGANGSGKSTLLRLLDGLLLPQRGRVVVGGRDTADTSSIGSIRRLVGFVFQNPDAQLVATTVQEEAAFGPENIGLDPGEIRKRVDVYLGRVGLDRLARKPSHMLSVGQKQLLAFASVLAMEPWCLLLDEATAFLDPASRDLIMEVLDELSGGGTTIVSATHDAREAARARRLIFLSSGRTIADGKPESLFMRDDLLAEAGLEAPASVALSRLLVRGESGGDAPFLDEEGLIDWVRRRYEARIRKEERERL